MDISCDIIRDLLPLYAEDLVSDATRELVDDHLCGCDPCTKQLGILKKAAKLPVEVDTGGLKRLENLIRRKRIVTVMAAVLTVITVLLAATGWLNVTVYLDPENAVIAVEPQEDGSLWYKVPDYVMGHSSFGWHQADYDTICYAHTWNSTRLDILTALWESRSGTPPQTHYYKDGNNTRKPGHWENTRSIPESDKVTVRMEDCHHWYLDAYSGSIVQKLWGEEGTPEPEPIISPSEHLRKNFWGSLCLSALLAAFTYIPMKPWFRELLQRFAIVSGSVGVSQLFLTGGKFVSVYVSDEPFRTLRWVYCLGVFVALTVLFWRQLHRLNHRDPYIEAE